MKRIGQYKFKLLPEILVKDGEYYCMVLNPKDKLYETSLPPIRVGKIGNSYPKKKKFTLTELVKLGYRLPKKEDKYE